MSEKNQNIWGSFRPILRDCFTIFLLRTIPFCSTATTWSNSFIQRTHMAKDGHDLNGQFVWGAGWRLMRERQERSGENAEEKDMPNRPAVQRSSTTSICSIALFCGCELRPLPLEQKKQRNFLPSYMPTQVFSRWAPICEAMKLRAHLF